MPFDDACLFPLSNNELAEASPDRKFFFSREDMLLARYKKELGVSAQSASLDDYLKSVVTPELEKQKQQGAVAIKFEAAYLRSLEFEPAARAEDASAIYAEIREAARRPMPITRACKISSFATSPPKRAASIWPFTSTPARAAAPYFNLYGSEPLRLESVFNDPALRKTKFVMLHGGSGPFTREIGYLLMKPNVYADFSEQTWMTSAARPQPGNPRLAGVVSGKGAIRHRPATPAKTNTTGKRSATRLRKVPERPWRSP